MKFSLIICTYKRPAAIAKLLASVKEQTKYPDEILIIDGSPDTLTEKYFQKNIYQNLDYYKVDENDRGLTKQRNFGVLHTGNDIDICCFLDDDIVLEPDYFENLINTYTLYPDAMAVGGYILDDIEWIKGKADFNEYGIDGWKRKLGSRNLLRKKMGLLSDQPPGIMPEFSNGLSISFLPPSEKIYPVEFFMGGVASYKKELFEKISFSSYFDGYGLYEDMDFCLRASKIGKLYVNTAAKVYHFHEQSGRPDSFKYGKMVIRNGWYVWREKNPKPDFTNKWKWIKIMLLLAFVRLGNSISTNNRKEAFTESMGRFSALFSLLLKKRLL